MNDPYFKKQINFEGLKFAVSQTLFSSYQVDIGTKLLLRTIEVDQPTNQILDLGCGYGPIGLVLAKRYPNAKVTMVDRDLLAVRYAKLNAERNNLKNVEVFGSIGVEEVSGEKYSLVVSNIPAKIEDKAIEQDFILEPSKLLENDGAYWFVVVSGLNRIIPKIGSRNNLNLQRITKRSRHTVYKLTT